MGLPSGPIRPAADQSHTILVGTPPRAIAGMWHAWQASFSPCRFIIAAIDTSVNPGKGLIFAIVSAVWGRLPWQDSQMAGLRFSSMPRSNGPGRILTVGV